MNKSKKTQIDHWGATLQGLGNDARYWDLRRNYGDYSLEVHRFLQCCAYYEAQRK